MSLDFLFKSFNDQMMMRWSGLSGIVHDFCFVK
uniref:Uncharacterized protein n=1 Tax=Arundo donax TaxID=35708 RepID=A0A0A9GNW5_ARUDO